MIDHSGRCCQRTPGDTPSWIRPHVCRLNPDHEQAHQCTCTYEWETASANLTANLPL